MRPRPGSSTGIGVSSQNSRSKPCIVFNCRLVEALGHPRRALHPARQGLPVDDDAPARQNLRLTIERRLPCVLRRGDVGDQRRRRHAALDEPRRRRGLDDRPLAGAAGVFGTDGAQHPQPRRNPVERLADLFADPMHLRRSSTGTASKPARSPARSAADAPAARRCCAWPCRASSCQRSLLSVVVVVGRQRGGGRAAARSSASCSAHDRPPRVPSARRISAPSTSRSARAGSRSRRRNASTISVSAAGSEGRSSGRSAMFESYTKML